MRIEVALSGNGTLNEDGTASVAEHLQALTRDMSEEQTSITSLAYKKDFTDMAQALT